MILIILEAVLYCGRQANAYTDPIPGVWLQAVAVFYWLTIIVFQHNLNHAHHDHGVIISQS